MDCTVLSWIYVTINADLQQQVMLKEPSARVAWLALDDEFLGQRESRVLLLSAEFRNFKQGALNITDYCRRLETMASALAEFGDPVGDRTLVMTLIRGLNGTFRHMMSHLKLQHPFPTFNEARNLLLLEEVDLKDAAVDDTSPPAALYTSGGGTPQHPSSGQSGGVQGRAPSGGTNDGQRNNRRRGKNKNNGNGGGSNGGPSGPSAGAVGSGGGPQPGPPPPLNPIPNPWGGKVQFWPYPYGPGGAMHRPPQPPAAFHAQQQPAYASQVPYMLQQGVPSVPPGFGYGGVPSSPIAQQQQQQAPWTPMAGGSWNQGSLIDNFSTMSLNVPSPSNEWYIDSGAGSHMANNAGILTSSYPSSSHPSSIVVGNGASLPVTSVGSSSFITPCRSLVLSNVLVAPGIIKNLISVRRFTIDNNCSIEFDPFGLSVKDLQTRSVIARCNNSGDLYPFFVAPATSTTALAATTSTSTLWHRRLDHLGTDALSKLISSNVISCNKCTTKPLCHACQLGRHVRLPFSLSSSRASKPFDLIHCDLWTSPILSASGYKYYLAILDDCTHYAWTFLLRLKSETFEMLSRFFAFARTQFDASIKAVQCDNGREFDNSSARTFLLTHGAILRMSCPYTSQQNGRAERVLRTINNIIRSLLFQASLPPVYWADALHTSTYLLNRHPTKTLAGRTPYLALHGTPPSYDHLRVFGCACYPNLSSIAENKFSPHSTLCVFLGYSEDHKGYQCLDLHSNRIIVSRHVVFDESSFPFANMSTSLLFER
jgi:hypothetical protein